MKAIWAVYQSKCALDVLYFVHACVLRFQPIRTKHNQDGTYMRFKYVIVIYFDVTTQFASNLWTLVEVSDYID